MHVHTTPPVLIQQFSSGSRSGSLSDQKHYCLSLTVHIRLVTLCATSAASNFPITRIQLSIPCLTSSHPCELKLYFFGIKGFCKWKSGCRCTVCPYVCCRWWWMPCCSELCQEHGTLRGTSWCLEHSKTLTLTSTKLMFHTYVPLKFSVCNVVCTFWFLVHIACYIMWMDFFLGILIYLLGCCCLVITEMNIHIRSNLCFLSCCLWTNSWSLPLHLSFDHCHLNFICEYRSARLLMLQAGLKANWNL